ncbi:MULTISPECIES: DUF63 family protein [Salinibaculum]|uniref:DUF63 family protein n=1 Tax=Salinibaculum TaxID=2732368 RepID=UPI0030D32337
MQVPVPFEGFETLSLEYTVVLLVGTVLVLALLNAIRPPVTQWTVIAFVPWMIAGSALHVFYQLGQIYSVEIYPAIVRPFFSAPSVYLTTFIVMGAVWIISAILGMGEQSKTKGSDVIAQYLGTTGVGVSLALVGLLAWQGLDPQVGAEITFVDRFIPLVGIVATMALTFVVYILIGAWRTYIIAEARYVGAVVLFAHLLDGVTTTIGVDILGTGERSVIPARIIEFAGTLPTAQYLGTGWLFLVVKLLVAVAIVVVFADYVRDEPNQGNLLFAFVAAVGLGPAMNNVFLFLLGAY